MIVQLSRGNKMSAGHNSANHRWFQLCTCHILTFLIMCQSALWAGSHGQTTDHCSGLCFSICKCETVRATTEHTAGSIFWPTADTGNDHYLERNKERRAGTKWSKGQERSGQLWFEFLSWHDDSWADVCRVVRQSCWNRLNLNVLSVSKINHGCGFFSPKG